MCVVVTMHGDFNRASRPSPEGLGRFADAVGAKSRPRVLRRLRGGLGASTHVIAIDDDRLVLKRYPAGAMVEREWLAMDIAFRHGLPAPRPVAVDTDGAWFGQPAIAMAVLPGRAMLDPTDRDGYARQVADALAAIHELPLESIPKALSRPHGIDTLDLAAIPAEGHLTHATVERIAACLDRLLPSMTVETRAFNHGDFHPGNLVWHNRRLTGVVDWSNARPGPRWSELAYFRVELAVVVDVRLAKQVLAKYEARTGHRSPVQPAWDLLHVLSGHTWMQSWLEAYREQGRPDLDVSAWQNAIAPLGAVASRRTRRLRPLATTPRSSAAEGVPPIDGSGVIS